MPARDHLDTPVLMMATGIASFLEPTCASLAAAGFRNLHALSGEPHATVRWSHKLKSFTVVPPGLNSEHAIFQQVLDALRITGARLLLPVDIADVRLIAAYRAELPSSLACVPVPSLAQVDELSDKLRFTRLMQSLGLNTPKTLAITPSLTVPEVTAALNYPIIAKPTIGRGGWGMHWLTDDLQLTGFLRQVSALGPYLLQEFVPGEDVVFTMLCETGQVFAIAIRRRWLTRPFDNRFQPIRDMEFIECDWLEEIGRGWVRRLEFSGVADFDLRVGFAGRRASFLECDPRMMGSQRACQTFGVNMAALLCLRALGETAGCVRAEKGRFLSLSSIWPWIKQRGWKTMQSSSPIRTGLRATFVDPLPFIARRIGLR